MFFATTEVILSFTSIFLLNYRCPISVCHEKVRRKVRRKLESYMQCFLSDITSSERKFDVFALKINEIDSPGIEDINKTTLLVHIKNDKGKKIGGLSRDLNPGPPAPNAGIIPLDH